MNILGEPYSIFLTNIAARIVYRNSLSNGLLVQAQEGDAYYRIDGRSDTVNGFIIPHNAAPIKLNLMSNHALTVWSTDKIARVRLVIQEYKER